MLLLIQIFFYIKITPAIVFAPSFTFWEGWSGPGVNGGIIIKTTIPDEMTVNYGLLTGMQNVSNQNDNFSYKYIGIDVGLEKRFNNILISGGISFNKSYNWQFNNYNLVGISNFSGYYVRSLYKIKEFKKFAANIGLSYYSYSLFKEFVQIRNDFEVYLK